MINNIMYFILLEFFEFCELGFSQGKKPRQYRTLFQGDEYQLWRFGLVLLLCRNLNVFCQNHQTD
jgi:hypothetical protein